MSIVDLDSCVQEEGESTTHWVRRVSSATAVTWAELMAALVKYADSDGTKDPDSDDEKPGKGKKSSNAKGQQHNPASQGEADSNLDFMANTNV